MSAVGDVFGAIAARAGTTVAELSEATAHLKAGQTGLLRLTWDNGDRTVLVNPALGGVTFGWNLHHTAADELFAAVEGTALHTRIIFDRMEEHGAPIHRVINGGGIPKRNATLNQIYANVLRKPVLVARRRRHLAGLRHLRLPRRRGLQIHRRSPGRPLPALPGLRARPRRVRPLRPALPLFREAYFALGSPDAKPAALGRILPELQNIRRQALTASPHG